MQKINKITQPVPQILAVCYFGECWACQGMPVQTQKMLHDLTEVFMDI